MHAASLRYQLVSRAMESWATTIRYCLIIIVTTGTPAVTAWLLTRGH
jgi:hypothetical protein